MLCLAVYGLGSLLGVPFTVVMRQGQAPVHIAWYLPLLVPLLAALLVALLTALVLGRRHAKAIALCVGSAVALLSLLLPLAQPGTVLWSTRIWLVVMHLIAWFLIVPQLARVAGDAEPTASEIRDMHVDVR